MFRFLFINIYIFLDNKEMGFFLEKATSKHFFLQMLLMNYISHEDHEAKTRSKEELMMAFWRFLSMLMRIWPPAGSNILVSDTITLRWKALRRVSLLGFIYFTSVFSEYMLPFTSKPIWPQENKMLNVVEIDSCPIIICLVSLWPGHWALLLEKEKRWGDITNHASRLEQRSIGRAAVNLVYYSFCNFRIQILWQGWEMNEWALQSERHRLPTQRERK